MKKPVVRMRALVLLGAFTAFACARAERSGSDPSQGPEPPRAVAAASVTAAEATSPPALWEAIDKAFTGCEGG